LFDPRHLQAFLRATAAIGRTVVSVPPFDLYLDSHDPLKYLNYAIPEDDAAPDAAAIETLRDVFRTRDRLPRLEWIEEAAPRVAGVLAVHGMLEELRTPLMACRPDDLAETGVDLDDLAVMRVGDDDVHECVNVQRVAFGQPPLTTGAEPPDPRARGGGGVLARVSGAPVSAATWTPIIEGVSEIVGVATSAPWRRRGLAGAVTAAAARAAFAAGASVCVLSPGSEGAMRVYARAGFRPAATMLHWSDAPAV
jgi:GNAT superfamily N-acetyltransferase